VADDDVVDPTAHNRATYDRIAAGYAENQSRQRAGGADTFAGLHRAFSALLRPGQVVADLGCGPGGDAVQIAAQGLRVVGMDLSAGMLDVASGVLPGRLAQADLRALPLRPGSLDGIWCSAALLHVPLEDTEVVLTGFRRSLRHGGHLALVTALGDSCGLEVVPYEPTQRRWFVYRDAAVLGGQLQAAGLEVLMRDTVTTHRRWLLVLAQAG